MLASSTAPTEALSMEGLFCDACLTDRFLQCVLAVVVMCSWCRLSEVKNSVSFLVP